MDRDPARFKELFKLLVQRCFRALEAELQEFADALQDWLQELFVRPRPDWRESLEELFAQQRSEGRAVTPQGGQALLDFLEGWSNSIDWSARKPDSTRLTTSDKAEQLGVRVQPTVAVTTLLPPPESKAPIVEPLVEKPAPIKGRGDQSQFAREAEEIVSEATGLPRNVGPKPQKIPGSGPGGFRIPDFPVRGPEGSVRQRSAVIEVKASRGTKFGDLSALSRQQIKDAVQFVLRLRERAVIAKDPSIKSLLTNAHVEVYSDLPKPKFGEFANFIAQGVLDWKPIPRPNQAGGTISRGVRAVTSAAPKSSRPGVGATAKVVRGIVATMAEAAVAELASRDATAVLTDLLRQIEASEEVTEEDWQLIEQRLTEIANMEQYTLGHVFEFFTYGQHSLKEQQALALMDLALDLGEKFGYDNKKTWREWIDGKFGHFEKRSE